jgi:hypothetical protein
VDNYSYAFTDDTPTIIELQAKRGTRELEHFIYHGATLLQIGVQKYRRCRGVY